MARASSAVLDATIRKDYADQADEIVLGCWLLRSQSEDHRSADRSEKSSGGPHRRGAVEVLRLRSRLLHLRLLRSVSAPNGLREMQFLHAEELNGIGYSSGQEQFVAHA